MNFFVYHQWLARCKGPVQGLPPLRITNAPRRGDGPMAVRHRHFRLDIVIHNPEGPGHQRQHIDGTFSRNGREVHGTIEFHGNIAADTRCKAGPDKYTARLAP